MDEETHHHSPPPSSHSAIDVDDDGRDGYSSSSSSSSQVREEDEDTDHGREHNYHRFPEPEIEQHQQQQHQQEVGVSDLGRNSPSAANGPPSLGDDTWSCVTVILTFWLFVSMTLIFGVYGPETLELGPNCSLLIRPNPLFVQTVNVEEANHSNPGLMLYGFYKPPSLDKLETWSDKHEESVPSNSHEASLFSTGVFSLFLLLFYKFQEWVYHLNQGSEINISYSVNSSTSSVILVIAQGEDSFNQWLDQPAYPNSTLSWHIIHGSGTIYQRISSSSLYYVAVGNIYSRTVQVQLKIKIRALMYDTSEAYYKCSFPDGRCSLPVSFLTDNPVVLTTPGRKQASLREEWDVKVSYGPRWALYILGIATLSILMLVAVNLLNKFRCMNEERSGTVRTRPETAPLLSNKEDDLSSWGSSYESVSNDENNLDEFMGAGPQEGKSSRDGDDSSYTRRLCAICFDAPRDSFFLPCGHCVACFACGTRIAEVSGICPICRRHMKKVKKIYTV
ncbi:E3 ubiquitin-protein ligase APD2 [Linum grandiflorum]